MVRLQFRFVILAIFAASFPLPLLVSSYHNATSTVPKLRFPPSLADGQLLVRGGRPAENYAASARSLSGQYGCRWNKDICTKEPIQSLLGPDCCSSMCTNMKKDVLNCGLCGHICFYGSICCNGACVDIFNNHRHCGACHNTCPLESTCQYGMCDYS